MQEEELDKRGSSLNISAKLMGDIQFRGFRIAAVEPLEIDESRPQGFPEALDRFAEEHDCHEDSWGYAIKLVPNEASKPAA